MVEHPMLVSDRTGADAETQGPRRLDPGRDLGQVASLIADAFAHDIDEEGQRILQEMRAMSRAAGLIQFVNRTSYEFRESFGGYVWMEDGEVVGNVTLSRVSSGGSRWHISNVAVRPAYRRRGISAKLMDLTLEDAAAQGGQWVVLQVRSDNAAALGLYRRLAFEEMGGQTEMVAQSLRHLEPQRLSEATVPQGYIVREVYRHEWEKEVELARRARRPLMQWERPVRPHSFRHGLWDHWLSKFFLWLGFPSSRTVGVFNSRGELIARLAVEIDRWRGRTRLSALIHPLTQGLVETALLAEALSHLPHNYRIRAHFPIELTELREALLTLGLQEKRSLVHMRHSLIHHHRRT